MRLNILELASIALDEAFAMDDEATTPSPMPLDLIIHDRKYHRGHWNGKSKCKYRDDRAAFYGITETESIADDIVDRLDPENVEGEEIDHADSDITGQERDSSKIVSEKTPASKPVDDDAAKAAAYEKRAAEFEDAASKAPNDFVKNLLKGAAKKAKSAADKLGDGGAIAKMLEFAKTLGYEFDPAALKGLLRKVGSSGKKSANGELSADRRAKLEKEQKDIENDINSLREGMKMASPECAAALQDEIDAMEKYLTSIKDTLSGKSGKAAAKAEQAVAEAVSAGDKKAAKEAAKAAKKAAIAQMQKNMTSGATSSTEDPSDIMPGRTTILSSKDFKDELDNVPTEDRIFAVSDFHDASMKGLDVSKFGTVIMAGDFTKDGATSHGNEIDMASAVRSGTKWLKDHFFSFCEHRPDQKFVLIAGNHDHFLGDASADDIQWPSNVAYLKDSEAEINGMRIYGTPWCEKRKGASKTASMDSPWARQPWEVDDDVAKSYYDKIPEGLDVLVVHQPPKADGFDGDLASVGNEMVHCGSSSLAEAIKRAKPKLVICGHLHDADHRPFRIGDSVIMNTAYVSGRSEPKYSPHEIGIERGAGAGDCGFFVDGENNHIIGNKQV